MQAITISDLAGASGSDPQRRPPAPPTRCQTAYLRARRLATNFGSGGYRHPRGAWSEQRSGNNRRIRSHCSGTTDAARSHCSARRRRWTVISRTLRTHSELGSFFRHSDGGDRGKHRERRDQRVSLGRTPSRQHPRSGDALSAHEGLVAAPRRHSVHSLRDAPTKPRKSRLRTCRTHVFVKSSIAGGF